MTDKEKIGHLIKCANSETIVLAVWRKQEEKCEKITLGDVAAIISRQKAEIERFKQEHIEIDNFARNICKERLLQGKAIADFDSLRKYINSQRDEAIKEFIELVVFEECIGRGDDRTELYICEDDLLYLAEGGRLRNV